ncbi:MgtC/SapB family protein [Streptococcus oralis]|uniref:Mg(2+) transport ATPase/permease n=1 Tax=Streptococcus oralis TaxID=1303 RepID=A0A139QRK6_STROR|nr:MgtC/SapB family protein [Streptococcus oralis]KXU04981.1 Mg(2+) transport ATPase/permease [Streptococcus oralis]
MGLSSLEIAFRIILSLVVGTLLGLERGAKAQPAGIRTHSIVCMAACLIMMTNEFVSYKFGTGDPTRLGAQVISGVGFLGAGTILITDKKKITGLTTAAGIWASAGLGLAIGVGFYEGAILVALATWAVITAFQPLKSYLQKRSKVIELYIVVKNTEAYNRVLVYCAENGIRMTDSRTAFGDVNSDRIEYFEVPDKRIASFITLELAGRFEHLRLMEELANIAGVIYVEEV